MCGGLVKTAEKTDSELSRYGLWKANFGPDINFKVLTFANFLFIFVASPKIVSNKMNGKYFYFN